MDDLILLGKVISDPTRVRVLAMLRSGGLCVCELCDALEISQSTLSTHLQLIRQARLTTVRKDGKWIYYALEISQVPFLNSVFDQFEAILQEDLRMQRDAARLARRLALRENGRCVLGGLQLGM